MAPNLSASLSTSYVSTNVAVESMNYPEERGKKAKCDALTFVQRAAGKMRVEKGIKSGDLGDL